MFNFTDINSVITALTFRKNLPQIFYFSIKTKLLLKRNQCFPFTPEIKEQALKKFHGVFGWVRLMLGSEWSKLSGLSSGMPEITEKHRSQK